MPSKIYGILASATPMPVLAEPDSEPAWVVAAHGCGWCEAPGDAGALAEFVRESMADRRRLREMGERARRWPRREGERRRCS